jgi:hypothetical protein
VLPILAEVAERNSGVLEKKKAEKWTKVGQSIVVSLAKKVYLKVFFERVSSFRSTSYRLIIADQRGSSGFQVASKHKRAKCAKSIVGNFHPFNDHPSAFSFQHSGK